MKTHEDGLKKIAFKLLEDMEGWAGGIINQGLMGWKVMLKLRFGN